jgi:hypothetical protein
VIGRGDVCGGRAIHGARCSKGLANALGRRATFAWLHRFRRLRIRWERRPELLQALMHLACAFICQRFVRAL